MKYADISTIMGLSYDREKDIYEPSDMASSPNKVTTPKPRRNGRINSEPQKPSSWLWNKDNMLLFLTMAGVLFGVGAGFTLRNLVQLSEEAILCISYPGEIFMRILKLIILPLVISSLISCCASLNARLNGKIAVRTFAYFALTSFFNACLGILLALLMKPGGMTEEINRNRTSHFNGPALSAMDAFLDIGRNIFPDNFFEAFFQQAHTTYVPDQSSTQNNSSFTRMLTKRDGTNNIGVIAICLLFGTVLGTLGTPASMMVIDFFRTIYQVVMKIMTGVMWLTPIGICSIICGKVLSVSDISLVVSQLGWFVLTVVLGVFLYQIVFMQLIYLAILRKDPFKFYWALMPGMLTAFATASTAAALPVTFQCMDKFRINQRISRYILPIGCSINMDGTALFLGAAAVFIAQLNDIPLNAGSIVTLVLVCTAGSMSSASVPSAALVLMLMVLSSINCPVEDVSLLFAVDWLADRCRTTNNMLGDCYASAVVEHFSRKELSDLESLTHDTDVISAEEKAEKNGVAATPL